MEQNRSKINASRYFIKETALIKQNTFHTIFGGGWGEQSCCILFVCFVFTVKLTDVILLFSIVYQLSVLYYVLFYA